MRKATAKPYVESGTSCCVGLIPASKILEASRTCPATPEKFDYETEPERKNHKLQRL